MKQILLNILDYLRYQVANDKCTLEEMKSVYESIASNIDITASVDDIAEFYNKPKTNVSSVISRNFIPKQYKPKRRVFYNFNWFNKVKPSSWDS